MTTKASPATLSSVPWTFATVAEMDAESRLQVGDKVTLTGYLSDGDGGAKRGVIVAAGTGTDDGGEYHDLTASGLQFQMLHSGTIHGEQFGAVDGVEASAQLQAAWDALYNWQQANGSDYHTNLVHSSRVTIQNQVEFKAVGGGTTDFMNVDLSRSSWVATTGGDLGTSKAMLKVRSTQAEMYFGYMNGNKTVACLDFYGVTGSRAFCPEVRNFKGFGIRVRGPAGSFALYGPIATEYMQTDAEYETQANYTAVGIQVSTSDWNCYNANVLFCGEGVRFGNDPDDAAADPTQVHFMLGHFVMGNAVSGAGAPFVDGVLVANYATKENHLDHCYFDNGVVDDYTLTLNINGGHYVNNGAATLTEPKIRLYATKATTTVFPNLLINNIAGLATVGFVDNGTDTWGGDFTLLEAEYSNMEDEDRDISVKRTAYNLYSSNAANIEWNFKPTGKFLKSWIVGTDIIREYFDATATEYYLTDGTTQFFGVSASAPILSGTGTPEGAVAAPVGSMFRRTDGGTGTTLYIKETGTGNTGWVAK